MIIIKNFQTFRLGRPLILGPFYIIQLKKSIVKAFAGVELTIMEQRFCRQNVQLTLAAPAHSNNARMSFVFYNKYLSG